jgi:1-aminocyclopropane-1-carboxylate deaminase/D-cysteine desulfhydrase-like pyridoxal-dependent ACC family enzyme
MGGIQSNHTRATSVACAMVGLPCYAVLRVPDAAHDSGVDVGLSGNLLPSRLAKAHVVQVPVRDVKRLGSAGVLAHVEAALRAQGPC